MGKGNVGDKYDEHFPLKSPLYLLKSRSRMLKNQLKEQEEEKLNKKMPCKNYRKDCKLPNRNAMKHKKLLLKQTPNSKQQKKEPLMLDLNLPIFVIILI